MFPSMLRGVLTVDTPFPWRKLFPVKDWIFLEPFLSGAFGVVHMVINARTGRPAAAKRVLESKSHEYSVDKGIRIARQVSEPTHVSCDPVYPLRA